MSNDSKSIVDLRSTLFATLEAVRNGTMPLDQARAVNEIGKTIIDTARVEVDFLRATGGGESAFIAPADAGLPQLLPPGIVGITRHRLQG